MKMKFVSSCVFLRSKISDFIQEPRALMEKALRCVFTSQNEVDIFVHLLQKALAKGKPRANIARVEHTRLENGGMITINDGRRDVAYLYYHDIHRFLEYDLEAKDFFDVSERYGYQHSHNE